MSCVSYPLYPFYTIVGCTTRNLCIVEYNGCILRTVLLLVRYASWLRTVLQRLGSTEKRWETYIANIIRYRRFFTFTQFLSQQWVSLTMGMLLLLVLHGGNIPWTWRYFLVHSPAFWINGMSSGIERSSPVRKIHDSANIGVLRILLEMGVSLLSFGVFKRGHDDKPQLFCVPRYLFGCPRYEKIHQTFQVSERS